MYWLDSALLILVALGALLGLWSGFLWQVARLASLSLALTGTVVLHQPAAQFLSEQVLRDASPRVVQASAYIAVFLVIYVLIFYLARMVHRGIRASELEMIDRLLGALLGAGKISLVLAALALAAVHYPHPMTREWMDRSVLLPVLAQGMEQAWWWVPDNYKEEMRNGVDGFGEMFARNDAE